MHSNPILLTFLSILYYPDLEEHIKRYYKEKKLFDDKILKNESYKVCLKDFTGVLEEDNSQNVVMDKKTKLPKRKYNTTFVNKWHVLLMLHKNKQLIPYRKWNIKPKIEKEEISLFSKITSCCKKKSSVSDEKKC